MNKNNNNKMSSGTGSVPDPKYIKQRTSQTSRSWIFGKSA